MFVPRKPHPLGNEYPKISCAKSKVIYNVKIVEGKGRPRVMVKNMFEEKGAMSGLMVRMKKTFWGIVKEVVMDSGFCVMEVLILIVEKGVLGLALIKKCCYWPKGVTS